MVVGTLAAAGAVSAATGVAFLTVARAVWQRPPSPEHASAHRGHVAWWSGLGIYLVLQGALTAAAATGSLSLGVYLASRVLAIPLLCGSAWGISFYMAYLLTGRPDAGRWLALGYALVAAAFIFATYGTPQSLVVKRWIVSLDDRGALYRAVYVLVGLAPVVGSLAYLSLLRRITDPLRRYRIVLVGGSILAYVGSGLATRLVASDLVVFLSLVVLGLAAASASVLAHYPPASVRRALGGKTP